MNFAHIGYFLLLLLLFPVGMAILKYMQWRSRSMKLIEEDNNGAVFYLVSYKFIFKFVALLLIIIALADPLLQIDAKKVKNEGIDIIVAMDISTSMLAKDVEPSRLSRAKMLVSKIIAQEDNNRLGLIFFAGKAYLQMPLSIDKKAALMYVSGASPNLAPSQGTNIADAVNLSIEAFNKAEKKYKVLIVITDGEDHEGADQEAVALARDNGIIVHTIGIGTEVPSLIPLENGEFKKDRNGQEVKTAINRKMITELAQNGGGKAFFIDNSSDPVAAIMNEINTMDRKEYEEKTYSSNDHQFVFFLVLSLLLLAIDFFLPNSISKPSNKTFKSEVK